MLDIEQPEQLLDYLQKAGHIAADEVPVFRVLAGGVSNRTVWVDRPTGESWVLAPPGTITPLVFEDFTEHIVAMQAVPLPHENWKTMLLAGNLQLAHITQFGELLGTIHRQAWLQRQELQSLFSVRTFFESLRLEPYYAYTAWEVSEASSFLLSLIEETRSNQQTLVHGDYSPKNVLVHQNKLILLDHEVIHWGDPAFDLGFSMTHLFSKAHHLPDERHLYGQAILQKRTKAPTSSHTVTDQRSTLFCH